MQTYSAGQVIDGFHLSEPVHRGGMATLWSVSHAGHKMPLLMKTPNMDPTEGPGAIVGFEVEQMILPRLSGKHVPRFVAASFSHQAYIVMERVEGTSLAALVDAGAAPIATVVPVGIAVARALHDVHSQLVIHHDVKPGNILLRDNGDAVLIDFGLARHEELPDLLAEESRLPVGTAVYIAPEEVMGDRSDPRSDIFALGVMLYELTTGKQPFGNPASSRQLRRRLWRDPTPPRALRADCPPWLQEVILRCMEVDADARYETAAQLAFALAHPTTVPLTTRAERVRRDGVLVAIRRRFKGPATSRNQSVAKRLASAPMILAAIDLAPESADLSRALRDMARRALKSEPGARLVCVNVLKTSRIAIEFLEDEQGRNLHVQRLLELRHWAHPLNTDSERITYHVLPAPDAAKALIEYAQWNRVDHIIIGARGSSNLRRYLGSISSHVVAEASCSVTVVRARPIAEVFAAASGYQSAAPG